MGGGWVGWWVGMCVGGWKTKNCTLMEFAELSDKAVFMGIGGSFYIWSPAEYENQYLKSQKILKEKGPPKLFIKRKIE